MTKQANRFVEYQERIMRQAQTEAGVASLDEALFNYFSLRRRQVIAELRLLERLLGLDQSIPERVR